MSNKQQLLFLLFMACYCTTFVSLIVLGMVYGVRGFFYFIIGICAVVLGYMGMRYIESCYPNDKSYIQGLINALNETQRRADDYERQLKEFK